MSTTITARATRDLRRVAHAAWRRVGGRRPAVHYFHQADDPYSHLAAQFLRPFAARYQVDLVPWIVPPPDDAAAPERARLRAYGLRDAVTLARRFRLSYPQTPRMPSPQLVAEGLAVLAAAVRSDRFKDIAVTVGSAIWSCDRKLLDQSLGHERRAGEGEVDRALADGGALRRRLGHYLGAMFYFEGEWYWGVDRLHHLEARLAMLGLDTRPPGEAPLAAYQHEQLMPSRSAVDRPLIELWFSFRSPYSYVAFPRIVALARHYGAELQLRFILPMVMRGLPVPVMKRRYILHDAKREADMVGLPFGTVVDPVGAGVARALAVLHRAIPSGLGEAFAEAGLAGAFARGIDLATDPGLFAITRRIGMRDDDVRAALADETWREVAERNRAALFEAGLWGAPTFRVNGGPAYWGQDRIWALETDVVAAIA